MAYANRVFAGRAEHVHQVREFVNSLLESSAQIDRIALVVSEFSANAVVHSGPASPPEPSPISPAVP